MKLLKYENYQVIPTDEAFMSKSIRDMFNADKSANKEKFMQQISIVYFMADPRSSYSDITDKDERLRKIIEQEGLTIKISAEINNAIDYYAKSCETSSSKLLESSKIAVDKVRKFLESVDFYDEDEKGKPKYTIDSVTRALLNVDKIAKSITDTEKIVTKELEEKSRIRNDKKSSVFEEGL